MSWGSIIEKSSDEYENDTEILKKKNEYELEKLKASEIKQMQKKYGKNWRSMIGNLKDNETIKQLAALGRKGNENPAQSISKLAKGLKV